MFMSLAAVAQYCVVSWNIARDTDYLGVNLRHKEVEWKTVADLMAVRNQLFNSIFEQMKTELNPDFFCLQEVTRSSDIRNWLGAKYEVHSALKDCVIAWDSTKYSLIEGTSVHEAGEGRYLALELLEKATQKTILIASAHLWGFDLANPQDGETERGDQQLAELAAHLDKSAYLTIVGMDANTTPAIYPKRLSILEVNSYIRDQSQDAEPTAYNKSLPENAAHLDYLYARPGRKFQAKVKTASYEALPIEKPSVNPSDHSPVIARVSMEKSKQHGFINFLSRFSKTEK